MVRETITIRSKGDDNFLMRMYYSIVKPFHREYMEHHHTEFEISLIVKGFGTYRVDDRLYDIRPGDIFLYSTNEIHCITDVVDCDEMQIMNIHFEPRFIWANRSDMFDAKYLKIFFDRSGSFENRLDRQNPATAEIAQLMMDIENEAVSRSAEYELMIKVKLLNILVLLIREYDYVNTAETYIESTKFNQISQAMRYLDENITESLSLDEIAAKANLNKTYFATLFRRLNGVTPWDYITARRVEKAAELLASTNMSVLEVATACGFNSASNFNRAFRKVTGMSPSDSRRRKEP